MTSPSRPTDVTIPAGRSTDVTIPAGTDQPTVNLTVTDASGGTANLSTDSQDALATHAAGQPATQVTARNLETKITTSANDPNAFVGQQWGDFRIGKLLGKGGMGSVYLGRQVSLDRPVAIKVLPAHLSADESFRARFAVEAKAVALINSQHVIQVYTAGMHEGQHYFAMEFVEGEDLSVKLRSNWRPTHRESLDLMRQATHGLMAAGELGIIHRDIKPANMMLTKKGMLKLMDFGLAKLAANGESDLTQAGTIMGTVSYFSPEQGRGDICDQRTDIYAIGVVLYEMLTGKLPFTGQTATSIIYQQIHQEPRPPKEIDPSISESYQGVVLKCMQKDAAARYQTAADLLADLDAIAEGRKPTFKNAAGLRVGAVLVKGVPFSGESGENSTESLETPGVASRRTRWLSIAAVVIAALGVAGWLAVSKTATTGTSTLTHVPVVRPQAELVIPPVQVASVPTSGSTEEQRKAQAAAELLAREQKAKADAIKQAKADELAAAERVKASEAAAAEQAKADEVIRRATIESKRRLNALEQQKSAFEEQVRLIENKKLELSAALPQAQKAGGWQVSMLTQERTGTERYLAWLVEQKHTNSAWLAMKSAQEFLEAKQVSEADRELVDASTQLAALKEQCGVEELKLIRDPLWKTAVGFGRKGELGPVSEFVSRYQAAPAAVVELRNSVVDLTTPSEALSSDAPLRIALLSLVVGDQDPLVVQVSGEQQRRGTIAADSTRIAVWALAKEKIPTDAVNQFASLASLLGTTDARVRAADARLEELSAVRMLVASWAESGTIPTDAAGRVATLSALVGASDPMVEKATTRIANAPKASNSADQESGLAKTSSHIRGTLWGALTGNPIDNSTVPAAAAPPVTPVPRPEFKPLKAVVAAAVVSPQNTQDVVLLTVGKDEIIEPGVEFIVVRGGQYVARIRAEKMTNEAVVCHVIAGSANTAGVTIQINDLAQNRLE